MAKGDLRENIDRAKKLNEDMLNDGFLDEIGRKRMQKTIDQQQAWIDIIDNSPFGEDDPRLAEAKLKFGSESDGGDDKERK